jgi:glycosyltransferase involved in cell wall biosynthesis
MLARRMRLLGLSNAYPPGSPGGYAEITADVMEGLAARGHEATMLVARMPAHASLDADAGSAGGVHVRRELDYVLGAWRRPAAARRAVRDDRNAVADALARERPDAAIVWHMRGVVKRPLRLLHDAGIPVFYMLHDLWALYEMPGSIHVPWGRLRTTRVETEGHVCFVSDWLRDEYARRGFRPARSHVVRAGVDTERLAAARRDPVAVPPRRLLFAGRLHPDKGLHVLLEALARVAHPYELTVAGLEDDARYARRLHGLANDRVRWLGGVPRSDVVRMLGDHDALVYPSTGPETYGLGILEAFAAGAVAISSAQGGPAEYVVPDGNALVFEPGDVEALARQLTRLAEDPELPPRLAASGQATARSLSIEAISDEVERLLLDAA